MRRRRVATANASWLRGDDPVHWFAPDEFRRSSAALCLCAWPLLTTLAGFAGWWPAALAVLVGLAGLWASWQARAGTASAPLAMAIHVVFGLWPLLGLITLIVGFGLQPGRGAATAAGVSLLLLTLSTVAAARRIRHADWPRCVRVDEDRQTVALGRVPLPALKWLVGAGALAVTATLALGLVDWARLAGATALLVIAAVLSGGPVADWTAAAWLLQRLGRRLGKPVKLVD